MGILAILQSEKKELTTWDKALAKNTYDLSKLISVTNLIPTGNFIEMYHEDMGQIIIEFDERKKPIKWNK